MIAEIFEKRNFSILVADDSRFMRYTMRNLLEEEGYNVIEAENGNQALKLFLEQKPDIILMDYLMPDLNGINACARLQKLPGGNSTPVIIITSIEDEDSINLAFEAGATDYISKPINWAVLRKRISRLLYTKYTEKNLNQEEAFASSIIDNATEGIVSIDSNGNIKYINNAVQQIFQYNSRELVGKNINILISEFNYRHNTLANNNIELNGYRKDKSILPLELTISKFGVGEEEFFTLIFRDITERKNYEKIIKHHAFYDYLTELPNRFLLKKRVNIEIAKSKSVNRKFAILYLDLDRFKFVNDTLGHDVGDKLLQQIAERLKKHILPADTIARIGGDEFIILLSKITCKEDIIKLSRKLISVVKEPLMIDSHEIYISASIGIAIYPEHGEDSTTLISNADVAMYEAKKMGRSSFEFYTESLSEKALERLNLENSLRHALEKNEFTVYYQPKVHAKTEKLIGAEALIRWKHSSLGLIAPDKFIPLAEETGLIIPIGEWVLRTACTQNKALQDLGFPPLTISVNLSTLQFHLQDLKKVVQEVLKETGLEPQYLELEITESIAMQNVEYTIKTINEIKEMGVKFSIDDFGTGYSSLSKLNSLSVDKLKIDKSFVSEIGGEKNDSIIASIIMSLGKSLELEVVAEGVETQEQVDFLKENTCDEMQGYFFGRPMCGEDFIEFFNGKLKEN
ncbi:diguanylate cyclase (GGDEF)-like protein/PAS domain S-box-containing protein [Clostridium pascui]|uniref:GGDEF domain-containing response regulator n=1 Tax=Clostridium pascui TaxID=46609 RepID=UPI00195F1879|nr:GGDEF domain-containing response regulator [Clostridium pascui]MBM7872122.1 diguanylate cyclase (GGDEF)-like protein/PAS domain S-box-containing protein [Clostridium pascui]